MENLMNANEAFEIDVIENLKSANVFVYISLLFLIGTICFDVLTTMHPEMVVPGDFPHVAGNDDADAGWSMSYVLAGPLMEFVCSFLGNMVVIVSGLFCVL